MKSFQAPTIAELLRSREPSCAIAGPFLQEFICHETIAYPPKKAKKIDFPKSWRSQAEPKSNGSSRRSHREIV
ncbi:hypothetical protein [Oxynema aestuarii]|uniref:Uncharacterized protein n=1 Tax=Oxynema aestuarii AP17 TaxID=2064643 RepID=A0A6H1TW97_9CYAN|nr:hypothetical protein [Oxynema aestuarii]QIZ70872.1 hypothetical protein HCG48_09970 [Oxynema aestuarii AP17]